MTLHPEPRIAPSMLASDFANLASEAKRMTDAGANWLHMDVMDGHFVPNLTIGTPVVASLRKHTDAYLDCHLMVTNPSDYVETMAKAGASGFTFHLEALKDTLDGFSLIDAIHEKDMRAGMAIKPGTSVEKVYPYVDYCPPSGKGGLDLVLVMTVEPGFGGQSFMPETMSKVRALRSKYPTLDIQVDGGLNISTVDIAANAGANCIVAGTSIFGASDPESVLQSMQTVVKNCSV